MILSFYFFASVVLKFFKINYLCDILKINKKNGALRKLFHGKNHFYLLGGQFDIHVFWDARSSHCPQQKILILQFWIAFGNFRCFVVLSIREILMRKAVVLNFSLFLLAYYSTTFHSHANLGVFVARVFKPNARTERVARDGDGSLAGAPSGGLGGSERRGEWGEFGGLHGCERQKGHLHYSRAEEPMRPGELVARLPDDPLHGYAGPVAVRLRALVRLMAWLWSLHHAQRTLIVWVSRSGEGIFPTWYPLFKTDGISDGY